MHYIIIMSFTMPVPRCKFNKRIINSIGTVGLYLYYSLRPTV